MAKKQDTRVRFLGGYAPRKDLLGVLSYPVALDGQDVEHTRLFSATPNGWGQTPINADIVSIVFEDGPQGKCWRLAGKRGDIYTLRPSGMVEEKIPDAGTGPGKYGYLSSLKIINGKLFTCGVSRQIYEYTAAGWQHQDQGILIDHSSPDYHSLDDIAGISDGTLCAVGAKGEIAIKKNKVWTLLESPTNQHLHAVCTDDKNRFCAAGANGVVVRGTEDGFEVLCAGDIDGGLWDIKFHNGELVVSASDGLFIVRDGVLTPFDKPAAPKHVGYKLATVNDVLWSIGTHQIFCLDGNSWSEWVCPDNA